mgnify:CR=1 FL=1
MVGLGCEMNQIDWLLEAYGLKQGPLFKAMNIQDSMGLAKTVEAGIAMVREMLPEVNKATRTPCPASELMVALQCGVSDALSGVTANPALGYACDLLVAQGGTGVLAETPEIYGAEHLLTRRATNEAVGRRLVDLIEWWDDYTSRNRGSMDNNPRRRRQGRDGGRHMADHRPARERVQNLGQIGVHPRALPGGQNHSGEGI